MKRRRLLVTVLTIAMLAIAVRRLFTARASARLAVSEEPKGERHGLDTPADCRPVTPFDAKTLGAQRSAANQVGAPKARTALCPAC